MFKKKKKNAGATLNNIFTFIDVFICRQLLQLKLQTLVNIPTLIIADGLLWCMQRVGV